MRSLFELKSQWPNRCYDEVFSFVFDCSLPEFVFSYRFRFGIIRSFSKKNNKTTYNEKEVT